MVIAHGGGELGQSADHLVELLVGPRLRRLPFGEGCEAVTTLPFQGRVLTRIKDLWVLVDGGVD